jgi:acyl-CoA reductase-like NAD-dependent aldehyde dehydrogenase
MAGENMNASIMQVHSWIDGAPAPEGDGEIVVLHSPWDGRESARIVEGGVSGVEAAAMNSRSAHEIWADTPLADRVELLERAADEITARADAIVDAMIADIGKPRRAAEFETRRTAAFVRATARQAQSMTGEMIPLDATAPRRDLYGFARRVPYGVVAAVTPFNAPANLLVQKLAPALAGGNAVVVKPSIPGTRVTLLIAEAFAAAGAPGGVCNVVAGGSEEALALASHPEVDFVTLTGGIEAGRALARAAGIRKFVAELGGNSPNIVLADADLDDAAKRIAVSAFEASGQQCISAQRVIVEEPVYDSFLERFLDAADRLNVGDPDDARTDLGPVVNEAAADRIAMMVDEAVAAGARLAREPRRERCVIHPTVVVDAPRRGRIVVEEIFGPVAVVLKVSDFEEAVATANACDYGLQAALFTNDLSKALLAADRIQAGSLWVNEGSRFRLDNYPFGGVGQSGHGREGIRYALEELTRWKFAGIRIPAAGHN